MMFEEILDTFENVDLKKLAQEIIKTFPQYFYEVGSSSTNKYHPNYALGPGGLYRHTIAACRLLNHMLVIMDNYTSREKDLMRIALIAHDSRKSGTQEAYENNKYTNFDHPLQAAAVIRTFKNKEWDNDEIELIAECIESHMNIWNTDKRSDIVLPLPKTKYQKLVGMCDYLASRKDLEMKFEYEPIDPKEYVMPFGKHKGKKLAEVDKDYLEWLISTDVKEPLKSLIPQILKGE